MNKVLLIGRLGKDAETKTLESGKKLTKFSLATTKNYGGEKKTTWHNIESWFDSISNLAPYLKKGGQVSVEGEISYNEYEKDGEKKTYTSIICERIEMLDTKKSDDNSSTSNDYNQADTSIASTNPVNNKPRASAPASYSSDDDLPF